MAGKRKFVISLYSPIGGQGVSFAAVQVAHQLAKHGPTCLLDLNLDQSVALLYLSQDAQKAFRQSAITTDESSKISNFAIKVEPNYFAIGVPLLGYGHFAEDVDEALKELFEQSRAEFDYTVIDLPHPFHVELTKQALLKSDLVIYMLGDTKHAMDSAVTFNQLLGRQKLSALKGKEVFVLNHPGVVTSKLRLGLNLVRSILILLPAIFFWYQRSNLDTTILLAISAVCISGCIASLWPLLSQIQRDSETLKAIEKNNISIFHELPNDKKSCLLAINQAKFLDDTTSLGKALDQLSQKIRKRVEQKS